MKKYHDNFDRQLPHKIFNKAQEFSKTFSKFYSTPRSPSKQADLHEQAEYRKQVVKVAVMQGGFQNQLYRTLEMKDQKRRQSIEMKISQIDQKTKQNQAELTEKMNKKVEQYNKHVTEVQKRFKQQQKQKHVVKKQKALELRKQLLEFYQKEAQRKLQANRAQVNVGTCYASAIAKINQQHLVNQSFAMKSEIQLDNSLKKNNGRYRIMSQRARSVSMQNTQKKEVYQNCEDILQEKQRTYIQQYGRDMDTSIFAFRHKDDDKQKVQKRISEFFKKKTEKWKQNKKRVDAQKAQVPGKCLGILDKTTKASFRQTMSSFRSSAKEWNSRVQKNKSLIKEHDQRQKDKIMEIHEDLRFRNTTGFKMNEKMNSFRLQARKTAHEFL